MMLHLKQSIPKFNQIVMDVASFWENICFDKKYKIKVSQHNNCKFERHLNPVNLDMVKFNKSC